MRAQPDNNAKAATEVLNESVLYRLIKHPLRHRILIRTGERPWCPTELAEDTREPLKRVCEQIDVLLKHSPPCLELVGEKPGPRGGTPRHFYRALVRVAVTADEWSNMTPLEQAQQTVTITEELFREWTDSINAGAFYGDPEHCLIRHAMTLDREAMREISEILDALRPRFAEIERQAAERRSETGEDAIRVLNCLALFRAASR
jgi:hypothetical protein